MAINVLIIDDDENNILNIGEALIELDNEIKYFPTARNNSHKDFAKRISLDIKNNSIIDLANYIKDLILTENIDIVILDLALAQNEESLKASETSGIVLMQTLLKLNVEILEYIPFFIYSIMDKNDIKENTRTNIVYAGRKPDYVEKDNIYDDFNQKGNEKLNILIHEAEKFKKIKKRFYYSYDILVVCALQEELDYVLKLPLNFSEENRGGRVYYFGKFENGKTVVAVTEKKMGMVEAAALTTRAIDMFKPKYVVMTGIAAGLNSEEQNPLDVLIPKDVYNWQAGKYVDGKFIRENRSTKTYYDKININLKDLNKIIEKFLKEEEGIEKENIGNFFLKLQNKEVNLTDFKKELEKLEFVEYAKVLKNMFNVYKVNVHEQIMVSGSAVVADLKKLESEVKGRKVEGLDMEAYGVAYACSNHPINPKPIIIKAICDFADSHKGDIYHAPASYVSAQVFYKMFNEELID